VCVTHTIIRSCSSCCSSVGSVDISGSTSSSGSSRKEEDPTVCSTHFFMYGHALVSLDTKQLSSHDVVRFKYADGNTVVYVQIKRQHSYTNT
jgi:hypothetical protein